jgi:hypothetical protein
MTTPDLDHRASRRRWLPTTAGAAVLILLTAAMAWPRLTADATTTPTAAPPQTAIIATPAASTSSRTCRVPQPLTVAQVAALGNQPTQPPAALSTPSPARPHLRTVIRNLTDTACDSQKGRYAHTQIRQWATNMSSSGGHTTLDVQVWQYQRWRAQNNSGHTVTITQPTEGQAHTDETYRPGELPVEITRLATDPGLLAEQLNHIQPTEEGPQFVLRAWAEANAWHSPDRAQRAAALAVFRDTDGIDFHGTTRDRAGRTGIPLSVTSDNGGGRDLLILDPRTGELMAFEMAAMRDPGRLGITEPTVLDYHLFLAHTHTATTSQP